MSELVRFFLLPWWWVQRRADVRMLWPICRQFAATPADAREAFLLHAMITPCWIEFYGERALVEHVNGMT